MSCLRTGFDYGMAPLIPDTRFLLPSHKNVTEFDLATGCQRGPRLRSGGAMTNARLRTPHESWGPVSLRRLRVSESGRQAIPDDTWG